AAGPPGDVGIRQPDGATNDAAVFGQQADHRLSRRGLARAGLAYQCNDLAGANGERYAVHCIAPAIMVLVSDDEIIDLQNGGDGGGFGPVHARLCSDWLMRFAASTTTM